MSPLRSRIYPFHRTENRIPMEVGCYLEGNRQVPVAESTFTENVSSNGAREVSVRKWEPDDLLVLTFRHGQFRSSAPVAYCQPPQGDGFAIGVEFLGANGLWFFQNAR